MREITVQINDELFDFIDRQAGGDRDRYLVKVLSHYRRWSLQQEMVQALQAEANDPEYQAEIALWDCTVGDGLAGNRVKPIGAENVGARLQP